MLGNSYEQILNMKQQCEQLIAQKYGDYLPDIDEAGEVQAFNQGSFSLQGWFGSRNVQALNQRYMNLAVKADCLAKESGGLSPKFISERVLSEHLFDVGTVFDEGIGEVQKEVSEKLEKMTIKQFHAHLETLLTSTGSHLTRAEGYLEKAFAGLNDGKLSILDDNSEFVAGLRDLFDDLDESYGELDTAHNRQKHFYAMARAMKAWVEQKKTDIRDNPSASTEAEKMNIGILEEQVGSFLDETSRRIGFYEGRTESLNPVLLPDPESLKLAQKPVVNPENTPGFRNPSVFCFANAGLKQAIIGMERNDLDRVRTFAGTVDGPRKDLCLAFVDLAEVVMDMREGKRPKASVETQRTNFFSACRRLGAMSEHYNADYDRSVAAAEKRKEKYEETPDEKDLRDVANRFSRLIPQGGQQQQDSEEFITALNTAIGLRDTSQEVFRYKLTRSREDDYHQRTRSSNPELFYRVDLGESRPLAEVLSESELMAGNNKVEWDDGMKTDATLDTFMGHKNPSSLKRVRMQPNVFAFAAFGMKKSAEAQALIPKEGHVELPVFNTSTGKLENLPFKLKSMVVHKGGLSVSSGHYITLENYEGNRIAHDDNQTYYLPEGIEGFFAHRHNRDAAPYLLDLERV